MSNSESGKVLIVVHDLNVGGAERHLVQTLPALAKLGVHVRVFTLIQKGALASVLEQQGIEVEEPPFAQSVRRLPRLLRWFLFLPFMLYGLWRAMRADDYVLHFFLHTAYIVGS